MANYKLKNVKGVWTVSEWYPNKKKIEELPHKDLISAWEYAKDKYEKHWLDVDDAEDKFGTDATHFWDYPKTNSLRLAPKLSYHHVGENTRSKIPRKKADSNSASSCTYCLRHGGTQLERMYRRCL